MTDSQRARNPGSPTAEISGFRAFAFPSADALMAEVRSPTILVALNAEKVANGDDRVRRIVNANVGYADGMGIVIALRRRGLRATRIAGADLWLAMVKARPRRRIYLIGSTPRVVRRAAQRIRDTIPGVSVVGSRDGYLGRSDVAGLKVDLNDKKPDLVFVGMGSPQQELLMSELIRAWPAIYMGIGGSLDVYVGLRRRAPVRMQRIGLEWVFRFLENPSRLMRLPAYLRFAWLLARGKV